MVATSIAEVRNRTIAACMLQVLELMELETIKGALVGVPGVSGLSVEQRKRLTIGTWASCKCLQHI